MSENPRSQQITRHKQEMRNGSWKQVYTAVPDVVFVGYGLAQVSESCQRIFGCRKGADNRGFGRVECVNKEPELRYLSKHDNGDVS